MAIGLIAGMTDYSHQSLDDILTDLEYHSKNIVTFVSIIEKNINLLKKLNYWGNSVYHDFKMIVEYSLKHYKTSKNEILDILIDIELEIQVHHCNRIRKIAQTSGSINSEIGTIWNSDYRNKNYGDKRFKIVESIYGDTRDMAASLLDLSNIASRLEDFIGKKNNTKSNNNDLKILFLSSSPINEERISVDIEIRRIEEIINKSKYRDKVLISKKEAVKIDSITQELLQNTPDILHFSGHGDKNNIIIENELGESVEFPLEGLVRLFELFKNSLKLIILNSCHSKHIAVEISKLGISVIGMSDSINDEYAINFSIGLYQALSEKKDILFSYKMGLTTSSISIQKGIIPELYQNGCKIS